MQSLALSLAAICLTSSPVSFELDVQPILNARGCSAGPCHGKQGGQNGFQLSLLCFDSDFDFAALTKSARGRRVFPGSPRRSLLLQKATGEVPHGGGRRLELEGDDYQAISAWIAAGMPRRLTDEPQLERVEVSPTGRSMKPAESQPLEVTAFYSDGSKRDVTRRTTFQSSESVIVGVDDEGVVRAGPLPGEATVMARYMGLIATCNVSIPLAGEVADEVYTQLPVHNFIDKLVWDKLKSLAITPSQPANDAKFMRRVYLDIIGRLPTPKEVRRFLADTTPNRREMLVDHLLSQPEYADHWANKWADLLRPNPYRVGIKAVFNYDNWIRENFRRNTPYDEFVRQLVTAQGSTFRNGAATMFRDRRSPDEIATLVSQLFLGVRLECAKCHHHPFERWSQHDFYGFAAWFAKVGRKGRGLSPPISGSEEIIMTASKGTVSHPRTGELMEPRVLYGKAPKIGDEPREALAAWLTSADNDYFAQVMANRVWADLMGRGLVEPVDDLRATNPPSNGPLLAALGDHFRQSDFDIKKLIRAITLSYVYSLSSHPGDRNVADTRNYSRFYRQRMRAEVLVDAVGDVTGQPFTFSAMPSGSRATQIWTHRVSSLILDTFGRPDPNKDPPCERTTETTVSQALHLMNAPQLHQKITSDKGTAAKLASSDRSPDDIVEEIFLLIYSRFPDDEEREIGRRLFAAENITRSQAAQNLMWALMNSPEFVFKD